MVVVPSMSGGILEKGLNENRFGMNDIPRRATESRLTHGERFPI